MKQKTTTFTFDDANQLVSSTTDGITTRYEYDAAGRLVREGNRTYTYGYLDKVMSVRDGANKFTYTYHPDGQLATADYGRARTPAAPQGEESPTFETFTWDGLALIQRGNEHFINEPHVGGGNPVVSSKGTSYFNDMLGTTVGAKSGKQYSAATLSAFGEDLNHHSSTSTSHFNSFFTGKPEVAGLGHAFLMRNYRAGLAKWQTADPMGYPDGWNALAYCGNGVTDKVDLWGCKWVYKTELLIKKYDFGDLGLLIPGGLPMDVNPTPPTVISAVSSWIVGLIGQGIADDLISNWNLIRHFANEQGYGCFDPTPEQIQDLYEDWEFVSCKFYTEYHESSHTSGGEFIYKLTVAWEITLRKWEE